MRLDIELIPKLEIWRDPLESKGFQLSRSKTQYMEFKLGKSRNKNKGFVNFYHQEIPKNEYFFNFD